MDNWVGKFCEVVQRKEAEAVDPKLVDHMIRNILF